MKNYKYTGLLIAIALATTPQILMAQVVWSPAQKPAIATQLQNANLRLDLFSNNQEKIDYDNITARYNNRIESAFQKKPALKNQMEAELKAINAETDFDKRNTMISAYQAKHRANFKQTLDENQINLSSMANELNAKIPNRNFAFDNNLSLTSRIRPINLGALTPINAGNMGTLSTTQANTNPTPVNTSVVKSLTSSDYTIYKDLGCGQAAGSSIEVSGGYMTNKSVSIVAGYCLNEGSYNNEFILEAGKKAKVEITYDLTGANTSIGLVGFSESISRAAVSFSGPGVTQPPSEKRVASCMSIAFLLWVGSSKCEILNGKLEFNITQPGTYNLKALTDTTQGALVGGSYGEARIKKLRATFTISNK